MSDTRFCESEHEGYACEGFAGHAPPHSAGDVQWDDADQTLKEAMGLLAEFLPPPDRIRGMHSTSRIERARAFLREHGYSGSGWQHG